MFKKGDLDAFFGVFFDGFPKILAGVVALTPILGTELMFSTLLPNIGLAVLISSLFFMVMGKRLKKQTNDNTVVAMPGGINAGRFFIWLYAIMIPVYAATKDPLLTLFVGIGANILSSIVSILFAFIGERLVKMIPSEVLFGSLGGGALAWLTLATFNDLMAIPLLGMIAIFIVIPIYLAKIKTPVSPAAISVLVCVVVGAFMGVITKQSIGDAMTHFGFYVPAPGIENHSYVDLLAQGFIEAIKFLPIIVAFSLGETVSNLQALEQASSVNDKYNKTEMLVGVNIVSLITAFLGNPFCIGLWWGHPTWKDRQASTNYPILVGGLYFVLTITGIIGVVAALIPIAAVLPVLVFIGLISFQGAFSDASPKFYGLMALCVAIPIMEWGQSVGEHLGFMAQGSMITALVWGCAIYFIMVKEHIKVIYSLFAGVILSFMGLIHTNKFILVSVLNEDGSLDGFTFAPHFDLAGYYIILAAAYFILWKLNLIKYEEA